KMLLAGRNMLAGYPRPANGEALNRTPSARRARARKVARHMRTLGVTDVLHTGTLDLPAIEEDGAVRHYLYCDHSWNLARRYWFETQRPSRATQARYDALEAA